MKAMVNGLWGQLHAAVKAVPYELQYGTMESSARAMRVAHGLLQSALSRNNNTLQFLCVVRADEKVLQPVLEMHDRLFSLENRLLVYADVLRLSRAQSALALTPPGAVLVRYTAPL